MRTYVQRARAIRTARTSAAIERAVLGQVARRGYARVRVADVARRARVSPRTVYLHARSKAELVERVMRDRAQTLAEVVRRWRPRGSEPETVIDELVAMHSRSYRAEAPLLETLTEGGPPGAAQILRELDAVRLSIIARTFGELARHGALSVRAADATALAHAMLSYPTWRVALTGPAGRRAQRLLTAALRAAVLA